MTILIKAVLALRDSTKIAIVDAPPGTPCPVIEIMKPAEYLYLKTWSFGPGFFTLLVTEPTPFGLNDLKPAVGALCLAFTHLKDLQRHPWKKLYPGNELFAHVNNRGRIIQ